MKASCCRSPRRTAITDKAARTVKSARGTMPVPGNLQTTCRLKCQHHPRGTAGGERNKRLVAHKQRSALRCISLVVIQGSPKMPWRAIKPHGAFVHTVATGFPGGKRRYSGAARSNSRANDKTATPWPSCGRTVALEMWPPWCLFAFRQCQIINYEGLSKVNEVNKKLWAHPNEEFTARRDQASASI